MNTCSNMQFFPSIKNVRRCISFTYTVWRASVCGAVFGGAFCYASSGRIAMSRASVILWALCVVCSVLRSVSLPGQDIGTLRVVGARVRGEHGSTV